MSKEPVLKKHTPREYMLQESHEKRYSNFGIMNNKFAPQEQPAYKFLKIFTACVAIFVVTDFFLHNTYFQSSCKLTVVLQKQNFLRPIAAFCSGPLTYWSALYLVLILPMTPFGYVKTTHYLVIYFLQLWFLSWMKPAYGRSRPMLECTDIKIWSCACDYGFPSGHSSIGAMNGYILGDFAMTHLKMYFSSRGESSLSPVQVESKFKWVRVVSWIFGGLIACSRLVLGVHSWNQVVVGFSLGLLIILWLNEDNWKKCILAIGLSTRNGKRTYLYYSLGIFAVTVLAHQAVYFYANSRVDIPHHDSPKWKRCPNCKGTFKNDSIPVLGGIYMLSAMLYSFYKNSLTIQKTQGLTDQCGAGKFLTRVAINTVLMGVFVLFCSAIALVFAAIWFKADLKNISTYIYSIVLAANLFASVVWILYWRPLILLCCGLAIKKDFIQPNIGLKKTSAQKVDFSNYDSDSPEEDGMD
jgi:membrane-associated phospholipid phosphatase